MFPRITCFPTCVALVVAGLAAPPAHAQLYTSGHGDIGVAYEGSLFLHYHLGVGAVVDGTPLVADEEVDPADLITRVADPALVRPAGAVWDFLGTPAGSPFWRLPQINDPARPFLGIATEELEPDEWSGISFRLTDIVSRPSATAQFSLWQNGDFGPERIFDTGDGSFANDVLTPVIGAHDHYNFGFTEPGAYQLEITFAGVHALDGFQSDSAVFTFLVGQPTAVPEPGAMALVGIGLAGCIWLQRRRSRQAATSRPE